VRTKKIKRRTMAIAFEGLYSQGDRESPLKMALLGRRLESALALAGRAAGIVRLYCQPKEISKPRPRGR